MSIIEDIKENLTKQGRPKPSILKKYSLTLQQAFDLLYPEKIKYCKYCGNLSDFISFTKGYRDRCASKDCAAKAKREGQIKGMSICNSKEGIAKREQTCLKKYGVRNPFQLHDTQLKVHNILIQKYGKGAVVTEESIEKNKANKFKTLWRLV